MLQIFLRLYQNNNDYYKITILKKIFPLWKGLAGLLILGANKENHKQGG